MDGTDRNEAQIREANALYWESETSVNRIAHRLGLSKGSLYAAIEPLASESFCPLCTARLVYPNRTALEKGHLQCSKCGTEFTEKGGSDLARRSEAAPAPASTNGSTVVDDPAPAEPVEVSNDLDVALKAAARTPGSEASEKASGQLVLGTTMLGLGVGLLLARVLRR